MPEIEECYAAPVRTPLIKSNQSILMSSSSALFGKYELGRLLGCGAFAKVYHARDIFTGQSVAVKVISKKKIAGTTLTSNIKREISIMSKLRHPNIVKLHEVLASKTKIYFVMDFVKGGELFARVAKGRFSEEFSRKYFRQLISAVGYCHSRGIFHRDLKPENLLVDENGDLKVSDFGLSAFKDQVRSDGLLHTLCGTPAYVAPEILAKKGYNGAKVDLWSCGVILYVLTAGYLPFNDPNLMNMYKKIYKGEYRCPKWMSSDLKRFLSRILDTNPDTRITIDEINTKDPWFRKGGYKEEVKFHQEYDYLFDFLKLGSKREAVRGGGAEAGTSSGDASPSSCSLNAFDLISFSSGLDLSGIFDVSRNPVEDGERFLSAESPQRIIELIEGCITKEEDVIVKRKKEWGVELDGNGANGGFIATVEINQLTEVLVIVEVKRRAGDAGCYREFWKKKIRPHLRDLVFEKAAGEAVVEASVAVDPVSPVTSTIEN